MPFINEILNYSSLSIVGLEKNTGKTECFNYILNRLPLDKITVGVSSIGIDGEKSDLVTRSSKPEIFLREGIYFTTSEKHYRKKRIISELVEVSENQTSLGRLVTAKAISRGRAMLSGPPATPSLKRWSDHMRDKFKVSLTIVDGALSRLSPASPAISQAMVLATGAVLSRSPMELINKTLFTIKLIELELCKTKLPQLLTDCESGVWIFSSKTREFWPLFDSAFLLNRYDQELSNEGDLIYVAGALTDRLLNKITLDPKLNRLELVVRDFTKIFASQQTYGAFLLKGGRISVLLKSKLIAVCVNPLSPDGYQLDSNYLCKTLSDKSNLPVYDIFKIDYQA